MRPLLLAILLAAFTRSFAQTTSGTYRPEGQPSSTWAINQHRTLMWDGKPYMPVGLRIEGTAEEIARAKEAGIKDVIVELPANGSGWEDAFKALEAAGMRYLVAIDSLAPSSRGFAVEPASYRLGGITEDTTVDFPMPGATKALVILANQRDGNVEMMQKLDLKDGRIKLAIEAPSSIEHVLLIYPEVTSASQPDYWEGFDRQRDLVLTSIKRSKPGRGLRGIVNPIGSVLANPKREVQFVPTSAYFRMEFKQYLQERYRNIDTALRAWAMSAPDITSFDDLARLVPLYSASRGVPQYWDPESEKVYKCEPRRSSAWSDISVVVHSAGARRYDRLVAAIQQVADVPVVQEWSGWGASYEGDRVRLAGLGIRTQASSPSQIASEAAGAASSVYRWSAPGWLVATNVQAAGEAASSTPGIVDLLSSLGVRAWFFNSKDKAAATLLAEENERKATDASLALTSTTPLFFPESAANPAVAQALPGGRWWLPSPNPGNRVDLGTSFSAYRYSDGNKSFTAIWSNVGPVRAKLRMSDPKTAVFSPISGVDPKVKLLKNGVEMDLSDVPVIVTGTEEIPIPEAAFLETVARFEELQKMADSLQRDTTEEQFLFRDAIPSFERTPGATFALVRQLFWRMSAKLGLYHWIEAEGSKSTNFSEPQQVPGTSGGTALTLRAPAAIDPRGYFADYMVTVRGEPEVEVWIAAKMSPEVRKSLRVSVGGQTMEVEGEPLSYYSSGFAWYRFGKTRLKGQNKVTIQVLDPTLGDVAIDALVIHPGQFTPNGAFPMDVIK
ncbi:MAG TPA: hypothetical protein VEX38_00140, partial [Fimbriimonadaceae bacterium]|nr:hypothetical protein [Fimbriimonadaceae bacterium]